MPGVQTHYPLAHGAVALAGFLVGHRQRPRNLPGHGRGIVGIDDQRAGEFFRRPGELAENQRTGRRTLAGKIFLGDEVHAIDERRDQAGVRDGIQRAEFGELNRIVDEMDGAVVQGSVLAIEPPDACFHVGA